MFPIHLYLVEDLHPSEQDTIGAYLDTHLGWGWSEYVPPCGFGVDFQADIYNGGARSMLKALEDDIRSSTRFFLCRCQSSLVIFQLIFMKCYLVKYQLPNEFLRFFVWGVFSLAAYQSDYVSEWRNDVHAKTCVVQSYQNRGPRLYVIGTLRQPLSRKLTE